ncbi:hypothetical protein [Amycolatopsis ultiminotia]
MTDRLRAQARDHDFATAFKSAFLRAVDFAAMVVHAFEAAPASSRLPPLS